jgi:hypothetical protein
MTVKPAQPVSHNPAIVDKIQMRQGAARIHARLDRLRCKIIHGRFLLASTARLL